MRLQECEQVGPGEDGTNRSQACALVTAGVLAGSTDRRAAVTMCGFARGGKLDAQ